jgi:predicted nucleic acid-binding protein
MVAIYFLDTSALIKRYVPEIGTPWMQSIADPKNQHLIIITQITWVEFYSAIARRQREQSIAAATAQKILAAFNFHWNEQYFTVPIDLSV